MTHFKLIFSADIENLSFQEPILRATQYLPGIVALQRRLYDEFNECKLDSQIQNQTFESFIEKEEGNLYLVGHIE